MSYQGYGQVPDQGDAHKKKKMAIIGISSLILVAMVVAVTVGVSKYHTTGNTAKASDGGSGEIHSSMKAIKAICQPTDYKQACVDSLSSASNGNTTDPKELVKLAFKVTIDKVKEALAHSQVLKDAEKDPRSSKALENCKELMGYAIDDLKSSLNNLGEFDLSKLKELMEDLKIWLSASATYQDTCLDGFDNTTGPAGASMKKALVGASELTSNSLAIVSELSTVLGDLKLPFFNRRLLEAENVNDLPSWVSDGRRRLLHTKSVGSPNVVVAKDGSGQCKTINEAIAMVPLNSNSTYVIYVKEGVYKEQVTIDKKMWNVVLIGDGPKKTIITGSENFIDGTPTFKTATLAVIGEGFVGKNFGVENSAGPQKHQAVAIRVQSDKSVFYNCQFDGYQDTLYAHTKRQFYRDCTISGTIDFIFGNAAVVFQNCNIIVRKPMEIQQNIVTAQGRKDRREPTAIILHNCTVAADPDYYPVRNKIPTFLGRPWKEYSRTFFIQSQLDDLIKPEGWLPWMQDFGLSTCFYAEFDNRGPGATLTQRVKWRGVKTSTMTVERAAKFTASVFIQGDQWIKDTGVPYTPGLLPISSQ
ncbi:putative pectinesterase/pectinesterase inhibitor 21 [Tasmannia lanceolata]|uniref:putative pectinesterase/pectinesterase inhibitor 21 n=1 Tax=Tasmannia lanceolata TaxID=3420 RepID=UPI00406319CE